MKKPILVASMLSAIILAACNKNSEQVPSVPSTDGTTNSSSTPSSTSSSFSSS